MCSSPGAADNLGSSGFCKTLTKAHQDTSSLCLQMMRVLSAWWHRQGDPWGHCDSHPSPCPEHSPAPAFLLLLPRTSQLAELISSSSLPGDSGVTSLPVGNSAWFSLKCLKAQIPTAPGSFQPREIHPQQQPLECFTNPDKPEAFCPFPAGKEGGYSSPSARRDSSHLHFSPAG